MIVWPSAFSSPRISHSASRLCGSRPAVGSSRNSTAGRWKIARATISRCAIPPDSAYTEAFAQRLRWNCSSSWSEIRRDSGAGIPNSRPWKYRFSHTVSCRSSVFCWETIPISCLASAGWAITSTVPTWALPAVGTTRVVSIPAVVVLPAPFGPSSPKISPASMLRSSPSTALKSVPG